MVDRATNFDDLTDVQKEVLDLLKNHYMTPKEIAQRRQISRQAVHKVIKALRTKGHISKGYTRGLRGLTRGTVVNPKGGDWRLHSQQFDIKILWRGEQYERLRDRRNMIFLDGNTIKLHRSVVEVYCNELRFFLGVSPGDAELESFKYWAGFFHSLEQKLGVILVKDGVSSVNQNKAHLADVGNVVAKEYVKRGQPLKVYALEDGKLAIVADQSHGRVELEFLHPKTYKLDADKVSAFLEGIRHYDDFTPKFVVDSLGMSAVSHAKTIAMLGEILEAIKELGGGDV